MNQYPILIISRDRLTCLTQLINWLEKAGHERIYIMDNGSTYEPLLDYFAETSHTVHRFENIGHTGMWYNGALEAITGDDYFVVTDPDVIPTETAPLDSVDHFRNLLDKYPERTKVGFGMKIDDIPDTYKFKENVIEFESRYLQWFSPEPGVIFAPIDTTFALYRPHALPDISYSIRTEEPYMARHMSWYIDSSNPGEEEEFYIDKANPRTNSWNHLSLPFWLGGER